MPYLSNSRNINEFYEAYKNIEISFMRNIYESLKGSSKKPYSVSGLIFFLAAVLSKFSRKQVRTAGANLRGTHRQPQQVRTAGANLRGTHRQPQQVRTAGAKLRGTHRHCAKFQKRFLEVA